jgi:hypothetical protein
MIRFSSLGYSAHEIPIDLLKNDILKVIIRLSPETVSLDEVVLTSKGYVEIAEEVGYRNLRMDEIGYWQDSVALGGELASLIRLRKGLRRLNTLYFKVLQNISDSVRIRVNLYDPDGKGNSPGKNLNQTGRNITHVLRAGDRISVIDLKPYDIWTKDDFVVSIELLGVYGTDIISLSLPAGTYSSAQSYRRYASQGTWEPMGTNVIGFGIQTTLYSDKTEKKVLPRQLRRRARTEKEISGYVVAAGENGSSRRSGATITNYTSNTSVVADKLGRYQLKVCEGDILGVSSPGMYPLFMEIGEIQNLIFYIHPKNK